MSRKQKRAERTTGEALRGALVMAYVAICLECGRTEMRNADLFDRIEAIRSFKKAGWSGDSEGRLSCASCSAVFEANLRRSLR